MNTISTFDAKNKLSELIAAANEGVPQIITKNGVETAVLISYEDFRKLTARKTSLVNFLLNSPLSGSDIDLSRSRDTGRAAVHFDKETEQMAHLLDTCVLAEFKKKQPEEKVITQLDSQIEESLLISVLSIGEIQKGITLLPQSKRRKNLTTWLEELIYRYDERVLPLDVKVLCRWGELTGTLEPKGRVLPVMDSLIAATALVHDLKLVTRNVDDFALTGVTILNIWE